MQGEDVAVCSYVSAKKRSVGVFNLGESFVAEVPLADGRYTNLIDGTRVTVRNGKLPVGSLPIIIEK